MKTMLLIILGVVVVLFILSYVISSVQKKMREDELNNGMNSSVKQKDEKEEQKKEENNNPEKNSSGCGCLVMLVLLVVGGYYGCRYCFVERLTDNLTTYSEVTGPTEDEVCRQVNWMEEENHNVDNNVIRVRIIGQKIENGKMVSIIKTVYPDGSEKVDSVTMSY